MPPILVVCAWLLIGTGVGAGHILLLRQAVVAASSARDAEEAGRRVLGRLPLRLLAATPVLLYAARSGFLACVALVFGLLTGRLAVIAYLGRHADALTE